MLPAGHPWSDAPAPPPTDNGIFDTDDGLQNVAQGYVEIMSFGLLGDDDGKIG